MNGIDMWMDEYHHDDTDEGSINYDIDALNNKVKRVSKRGSRNQFLNVVGQIETNQMKHNIKILKREKQIVRKMLDWKLFVIFTKWKKATFMLVKELAYLKPWALYDSEDGFGVLYDEIFQIPNMRLYQIIYLEKKSKLKLN